MERVALGKVRRNRPWRLPSTPLGWAQNYTELNNQKAICPDFSSSRPLCRALRTKEAMHRHLFAAWKTEYIAYRLVVSYLVHMIGRYEDRLSSDISFVSAWTSWCRTVSRMNQHSSPMLSWRQQLLRHKAPNQKHVLQILFGLLASACSILTLPRHMIDACEDGLQ